MAGTVRNAKLENRTARLKLTVGRMPHWQTIRPGELHLGYRRWRQDVPGRWILRLYLGADAKGNGKYEVHPVGVADDFEEADGDRVLTYVQASDRAKAAIAGKTRDRHRPPTVADAVGAYLEFMRAERKSAGDAESRANTHILPALGRLKIDELTTARLEKWKQEMAREPARLRSPAERPGRPARQNVRAAPEDADGRRARQATANRTITVLKAALNRAREHQLVSDDSAWRYLKPFRGVDVARKDFLSQDEASRLVAAADETSGFRALAQAALLTGCRYGELCALRVGDFARGRIVIRASKSGKARDVRLSDEAAAFFAELVAGRRADEPMLVRIGHRRDGGEIVATNDGWRQSDQLRPMEAACRAAGIQVVNFHQLRHTWASLAVMNGLPLLVVAHNLGHTDTRMVEKHYGHLTETYMDEAIRQHAPRFGIGAAPNVVSLDERRSGAA